MSKPRVAILGLGIMGGGMASRLLSMGFPVIGVQPNPRKSREIRRFRSFCRGHASRSMRRERTW